MQALLEVWKRGELPAEPACVIHNREQAPGAALARSYGVRTEWVPWRNPVTAEQRVLEIARETQAAFIVLAGFMRVIGSILIEAFPDRIINIHPSLLPAFPGLNAQQQALDYGVKVSGCTTHFVHAGVDTGPVILQRVVEVKRDDTEASLSARILEQEHPLIVETVRLMALGHLQVEGRRVVVGTS